MNLFGKKNKEPDQFENFPVIGGVMASKMVTEQKQKVRFLYRQLPANEQDSGWRIFSGSEEQDYVDNPDNIGIYNPSTILKIDPSISELLLNPVGSAFERETEMAKWQEVNDFEFDEDIVEERRINKDWTFRINKLFLRQQADNGDDVFVMKGKTVRIAIWNYEDMNNQQIIEYNAELKRKRDKSDLPILESFELNESEISRTGYMIEESDEKKRYKVIYGFTIVNRTLVQAAFYFDNNEDKLWAIETWKSILPPK